MSNERKQQLIKELSEIEAKEKAERDKQRFEDLVTFLDNADVFLRFVGHSRTSCSDEKVGNGYTTPGRGGAFRCNRCGLLDAAEVWKHNREWLVDTGSVEYIEEYLAFKFEGIDVYIGTFSED